MGGCSQKCWEGGDLRTPGGAGTPKQLPHPAWLCPLVAAFPSRQAHTPPSLTSCTAFLNIPLLPPPPLYYLYLICAFLLLMPAHNLLQTQAWKCHDEKAKMSFLLFTFPSPTLLPPCLAFCLPTRRKRRKEGKEGRRELGHCGLGSGTGGP